MLLKHSRDKKKEFLRLESFLIEKLKALDFAHETEFITTVIYYLQSTTDLTTNDLIIIFTKVSTTVNNIAMTAVEEITQNVTFNHVRGLWEKGLDASFIADAFKLPIKKVEEIINRLKNSSK